MRCRADIDGELFEMGLGSFLERGGELCFVQKEMGCRWSAGAALAFVDFCGVREMLFRGIAQVLRLVQEDDRFERAFRQFEERALPTQLRRAEEGSRFPRRSGVEAPRDAPTSAATFHSVSGKSVVRFTGAMERCVRGSNSRTDSTVSPSSSILTGRGASAEKTSTMPPRIANCPGSSTISVRV